MMILKNSRNTQTSGENAKKPKLKHKERMDYLNLGKSAFDSTTELISTIISTRSETKKMQIESNNLHVQLDKDLKALEISLQQARFEIERDITIEKEKQQTARSENENETTIHLKELQIEEIKVSNEHERIMFQLRNQEKVIDQIVKFMSKYTEQMFQGSFDIEMQSKLIQQMQVYCTTLNQYSTQLIERQKVIEMKDY